VKQQYLILFGTNEDPEIATESPILADDGVIPSKQAIPIL